MHPSEEVRAAVLRLYESMGSADLAAFEGLLSRHGGTLVIGTDPSEWLLGQAAIVDTFKRQSQTSGTRQVSPCDLAAFAEGTVGWAADRRPLRLPDGSEATIRETFVFHREDEEWKLVQLHASVALPDTV